MFEEPADPHLRKLQFRRMLELVRDPSQVDVEQWAVPADAHLLKSPAAFRAEIIERLKGPPVCKGDKAPWPKTHGCLQFRPHEVTAWFGFNGSFKSVLLNELFTYWACCGIPVAIASFEMPAVDLAALAVRQATALDQLSEEGVDRALDALATHMVLYDITGKVSGKHLHAIMRYCKMELGVRHFLVDNLTDLLPAGNDHADMQQAFTAGCLMVARTTGLHVHLVGHAVKPEKGDVSKPPSLYTLRGTGAVVDMIDNGVVVWRNFPKESALDSPDTSEAERQYFTRQPDLLLAVEKQKFWGFRGKLHFWMNRRLLRLQEGGYTECEPYL